MTNGLNPSWIAVFNSGDRWVSDNGPKQMVVGHLQRSSIQFQKDLNVGDGSRGDILLARADVHRTGDGIGRGHEGVR